MTQDRSTQYIVFKIYEMTKVHGLIATGSTHHSLEDAKQDAGLLARCRLGTKFVVTKITIHKTIEETGPIFEIIGEVTLKSGDLS